jgi:hypothetical protein
MAHQGGQQNVEDLLADQEHVCNLQEYAILENDDGTYEYVTWDARGEKLSWIRGQAAILEDVLCLRNITSEGKEERLDSPLEVKYELNQLPKWNKTKYYCVVIGEKQAALVKQCDTGELLDPDSKEYCAVRKMFEKFGVALE